MKHIKLFENFGEKTIQFRDHKGSKTDSFLSQKDYTQSELKKHIDDLYPGNTGFVITEYGDEYMVKVEIDGKLYPIGFSDSTFEEDIYQESKVNEEYETDDISFSLADWWISCDEQLPERNQKVIIYAPKSQMSKINICTFEKGISKTEREELKLSGDERHLRYSGSDEDGNNRRPYRFSVVMGPGSYFGQEVTHWMPLPDFPESTPFTLPDYTTTL